MLTNPAKTVLVLAVLAATGCASIPGSDPVMVDARVSVSAARSNPQVVSYAPVELDQAIATLRQAEDLAARGGRVGEVQNLALLANQRAALAQDAARTRSAEATLLAQRRANEAQMTADLSRRQAESAQIQATAAQRQAEDAQRFASQARADTYAPPAYDYRRRQDERLYEANVSYVRAVVGPPQQQCWVERERIDNGGSAGVNVPGAIIGGVIGGILGHQIGSGRGQDVATGVGVVGGAAVGANVGRNPDGPVYSQNVRRCEYVPTSARPQYWDVTYNFAGYEHRLQMTTPPGRTILVNAQGEPRV